MKTRWARDNRVLAAIGLGLGLALTGTYALFLRARALTPTATTNRVLLFVLFYIVVLLIFVLLFVLGRSAVKLVLDARRGVFGSRFRVQVVATHVGLALLPIALLVLPTTDLLQRSVERWFAEPVSETVRSGRQVAELVRKHQAAMEQRTAERLAAPLAGARNESEVVTALSAARHESGLDFLEWRPSAQTRRAAGGAVSTPRWPLREVNDPSPDWIEDARSRGFARRIEETGNGGQIGRTVAWNPAGFLILGTYDPPEEATPLRNLTRSASAYAGFEQERASLEAIQVLLFLLSAVTVLIAAVWVGLLLARRVTRPIAALAASARRVGTGDFNALVEVEGGDEIAALSRSFNTMTNELRMSRGRLEAANAEMAETNRRLDAERNRVRAILAHLDAGVVAFETDETLLAINETARRLLGRACPEAQTLGTLLSSEALSPLRDFLQRAISEGGPRETTLTLPSPDEEDSRVVEARLAQVPGQAGEGASWVVTLEDTTALVRAERAAAWEEAARRMAHEIKNPLTPIRLAAERMRRRAMAGGPPGDLSTVVEEGASTIVEEVRTLAALVDAFGRFARLPAADLTDTDLAGVVGQVVKLYVGLKAGVDVAAEIPSDLPQVRADAEQVKRALINLVDNAVAATPRGGHVTVQARVEEGHAKLIVSDDGPGIPVADRSRIFDPAYSTKPRGTGLGLAITARIATEHAGRVTVEKNHPRGSRFTLEWPVA